MPRTATYAHGHGRRAVSLLASLRHSYRPAPPADGLHTCGLRVQPCKCRNLAKHAHLEARFDLPHSPAPTPQPWTLKHLPQNFDPTDPLPSSHLLSCISHRVPPVTVQDGVVRRGAVSYTHWSELASPGEPRAGVLGRLRRLAKSQFCQPAGHVQFVHPTRAMCV